MDLAILLNENETEAVEENAMQECCDPIYKLARRVYDLTGQVPVLLGTNASEQIYQIEGLCLVRDQQGNDLDD